MMIPLSKEISSLLVGKEPTQCPYFHLRLFTSDTDSKYVLHFDNNNCKTGVLRFIISSTILIWMLLPCGQGPLHPKCKGCAPWVKGFPLHAGAISSHQVPGLVPNL